MRSSSAAVSARPRTTSPGTPSPASPVSSWCATSGSRQRIRAMFKARGRDMPANNLRQADVPVGATTIAQQPGTAPGLVCPIGDKVVYAMPGVPSEMKEMLAGTVIPDLRRRSGDTSVILSRVLRTWGQSESGVAEQLAGRMDALDAGRQPDDRLPRLGHRGHQGPHHGQGRRRRRPPVRAARRRGAAGPRRPGRPGLRPRRRDDGERRGHAAGRRRPHRRAGRVADRRADGLPPVARRPALRGVRRRAGARGPVERQAARRDRPGRGRSARPGPWRWPGRSAHARHRRRTGRDRRRRA